jgi:hypothetical protein
VRAQSAENVNERHKSTRTTEGAKQKKTQMSVTRTHASSKEQNKRKYKRTSQKHYAKKNSSERHKSTHTTKGAS